MTRLNRTPLAVTAPPTRLAIYCLRDPLALVAIGSVVSALAALLEVPIPLRLPIGLVGALVLPGYALSLALLPAPRIDAVGRMLLAGSLSLGLVIVAAPFLDVLGLGLLPPSLVLMITAVTLASAGVAIVRRRTSPLPGSSRHRNWARNDAGLVGWRRIEFAPVWLLVIMVAAAAMSVTLAMPGPSYTEFFMVGADGYADSYPTRVRAGQPITLDVGISSHERSPTSYRISVRSGVMRGGELDSISLEPAEMWSGSVTFTLTSPGADREVSVDLYRGTELEPYRSLRLWIDVLDGE